MSAWNGKGGAGGSPEFVHVDAVNGAGSSSTSGATDKSSGTREREQKGKTSSTNQRGRTQASNSSSSSSGSTNWQSAINRLTDQTIPEDQAAIRRLGDEVRKAGANGARAAVDALRARIVDKNSTPEIRVRSIAVARILAQKASSGGDAQRLIAAPPFISALKSVASDPNVRASLKTWASQIRIGDPNDASELAPVTGLDEHLAQASESTAQPASRRAPASTPGTASFQGRTQLATTEEEADEDLREGARNTEPRAPGDPSFGAPMPGGFGVDGVAYDANASVVGGPPGNVREFPASSIQGIPPHLLVPPGVVGGMRAGWGGGGGEEEEGVQSDAPSARSKRTSRSARQQPAFGGATPSMDGGREARSRLNERGSRRERGGSPSSSLLDGTLSEPDSPAPHNRQAPRGPAAPPGNIRVYPQRVASQPQPMGRGRQPSVSPDRYRSRSPSPANAGRSRSMAGRSRAQSRRRPAAGADPAAVLINLAGVQFVRVTQEYFATREDELTLREGEVLALIRREDDGRYWLGHSQGRVGRFPVHVVELLSHQTGNQGDSAAQEEKTAELLRRAREIDDFMDQLHDFDITRYCITEDADIQAELAALLGLRNEVVRHLDETTTGIGRLKAMLNKIKEAQRVHDKMIDSRIAGYAARTALHDATPRITYQDLPGGAAFPYAPFDMAQYVRRASAQVPQQIEQALARPSIAQRTYGDQRGMYVDPTATLRYRPAQEMGYAPRPGPGMMPRARTYSYTPATPTRGSPEESSSAFITEPSTPGEAITGSNGQPPMGSGGGPGGMNGRFAFPVQQPPHDMGQGGSSGGGRGERERVAAGKDEAGPALGATRVRGGSHIASETSSHTHTSRRGAF